MVRIGSNLQTPAIVTRQERLSQLGGLCEAIASALQSKGPTTDRVFVSFRDFISLTCPECSTRVSGEELYILSQPAEGDDLTVPLRRLRLGFCANPDCKSYHCNLTFKSSSEVDWGHCLGRADRILKDLEDVRAGRGKGWRSQLIRPTIIAVSGLLLILLLRQLYFGGRIPLLREPEKFRVDPPPEGTIYID